MASKPGTLVAACIGYGARGSKYCQFFATRFVADPSRERRDAARKDCPELDAATSTWQELLELKPNVDFVMICTQDRGHYEPALAFIRAGYNIMLEKPAGATKAECQVIAAAAVAAGVFIRVCHIMRYAPHNIFIKSLIDGGELGALRSIEHTEPVGDEHFVKSYVRGPWGVAEESTPFVVAKGCHDVDLVSWWCGGKEASFVFSTGTNSVFTRKNKPEEATGVVKCKDCPLVDTCRYSAKRYVGAFSRMTPGKLKQPLKTICPGAQSVQDVEDVLASTKYGNCVYGECDNTTVDDQFSIYVFPGEKWPVNVSVHIAAMSTEVCIRKTRIFLEHGEIHCEDPDEVTWRTHGGVQQQRDFSEAIESAQQKGMGGHEGADFFFCEAFERDLRKFMDGENGSERVEELAREMLLPHVLAYETEEARVHTEEALKK